jgi:hypothetical protein
MNQQITEIYQDLNRCSYLISAIAETLAETNYEASESLILLEKQLSAIADQLDSLPKKTENGSYIVR